MERNQASNRTLYAYLVLRTNLISFRGVEVSIGLFFLLQGEWFEPIQAVHKGVRGRSSQGFLVTENKEVLKMMDVFMVLIIVGLASTMVGLAKFSEQVIEKGSDRS
ncbi:hypothetical protein EIZ39_09065 [Ammoniphilus sp. CFH 90114]|nr:hypothetical protein EIZ39_09065 [Ammoniphilus sp. CFH 90114]